MMSDRTSRTIRAAQLFAETSLILATLLLLPHLAFGDTSGPIASSTEASSAEAMPAEASSAEAMPAEATPPASQPCRPVECLTPVAAVKPRDKWNIEIMPYLWIAGLRGDVGASAGETVLSQPIDASFNELTRNLEVGAMGSISFRYGPFSVAADANYLAFGAAEPISPVTNSEVAIDITAFFGGAVVAYGFEPWPGFFVRPYVGARWWALNTKVQIDGGLLDGAQADADRAWADPVLGVGLTNNITEKWFVQFSGDVGGGVSKVSWQVYAAVGYRFTRWFGLWLGYRFLGVNYDRDGFLFDITTQGLLTGLRFTI